MRLHFLGANRQVTGSRCLLEAGGLNLLIDCGMFQERPFLARNWEEPPFDPAGIDALLLTHAHLDHAGLIPRLILQGYRGPVYAVEPSVDLAEIILLDAGGIQEEETAYKKKRHQKEGRKGPHPEVPLYTEADARRAVPLFEGVPYHEPVRLGPKVTATFYEAGHILGSACVAVDAEENGRARRIVFSGDLGQWDNPLLNDPELIDRADAVVMESTYGDRLHRDNGDVEDRLAGIIRKTAGRGGKVVIPTFAMERAQELLYYLGRLARAGRIPYLPVFLDSPMAIEVTEVFRRHCRYLDDDTRCRVEEDFDALTFPGLKLTRRTEDSIAINDLNGPAVILASSGMCTAGRIKHHLRNNITKSDATVLFVGYQAMGTLGRHILDGAREVRIHGRMWNVRASVEKLDGLSAHGDRDDLLRWLGGFSTKPRRLFLTHGEEAGAEALADTVRESLGWEAEVPAYGATAEVG